jgi:hypothetical protein
VPLNEDEQRILRQIEEQFYQDDPKLAREVSRTSVYTHTGRQLKWAIAGVAVGILLMPFFMVWHVALGLVAFGIAFASGVWAYYSFRRMTQAGINDLRRRASSGWTKNLSSERLRRRFRATEED